jgi:hypothetical protein
MYILTCRYNGGNAQTYQELVNFYYCQYDPTLSALLSATPGLLATYAV